MIQEVGRLAGKGVAGAGSIGAGNLGRGVVLGSHQHLGRLFGDLASDRVHAAVEERRRVRAGRSLGGA